MKEYIGKKYYEILGVPSSSTTEEIKSAYRKLARKYHPDLNPGNKASEQKFKEITEAYNVLISDTERAKYDTINGYNINTGTNRGQKNTKTASTQSSYQNKRNAKQAYSNTQKKDEPPKEFNTVFSEFMDGLFSQKNKKQTPPPKKEIPKPIKGSDITVDVNISPDEAVNGTVKQINVLYVSECKRCRGKKFINGSSCPMCNGEGELSTHNKIRVKIPQNVKEGSKIRISNEGNKGQNGGENGDLFLIVHIIKHSVLKYDGLNVLCTIPITPPEAALGASIEVPTKDGFLTMKIPPGTSSGQKFKLASEGLKDEKTKQTGDQIVTVEIVMNKNLSQEEKDLYQKLLKAQKNKPEGRLTQIMNTVDVVEIFSSIQGEGPHIGERHLFLRLCGCNLRCSFCDTPFEKTEKASVYTNNGTSYLKNPVSADILADEINNFNPINHSYLSITGGEPLIHHKFLKKLIPMIHLPVYLETNGTLYHELEDIINLVSVISSDIKLPSSTGLRAFWDEHKKFLEAANKHNKEIFFKVVVTSQITEDEIQQLHDFSKLSDLIIQPVNSDNNAIKISQDKLFYLMDKIPGARIIPQCHKFLNIM